ncbi:MAG: hypothetical protein FJ109_17395 [Deltaproteobacteria bacterium]|nr:hypothetical protein [Deltaproteobacteria bacterium]
MSELKTKPSHAGVDVYVQAIPDESRRADCRQLIERLSKATGEAPRMGGDSVVGFGSCHYKGRNGREGDRFLCGLSSRRP